MPNFDEIFTIAGPPLKINPTALAIKTLIATNQVKVQKIGVVKISSLRR
jgi:hypothetical protein